MAAGIRSSRAYQRFWAYMRQLHAAANLPCALCHGAIDYALRYPHKRSWSLDHKQALHAGGALLDPANAQAAHLVCNQRRGAIEGNRRRRGGAFFSSRGRRKSPHSSSTLPGGSRSHQDPPPPPGW